MSDSVQRHRQQPIMLHHHWNSPGKNTRVGCHFLLQFRKVKSESEVAQSCPTLSDPMDCSLPGLSVLGVFPGKSTVAGRHCLLLRRNNLPQTNDTSLTQKWMFTCHLVIAGSSHHRPRVEDENAFSSWNGVLFPTVSASCRSPSPNIPPGTSR